MLRKLRYAGVLLLVFGLGTTLMGTEWTNHYFPDTVGSYWTYQDQDGNALTRHAVEPEEIDGETYQAFSYDPPLENWEDFEHYVQPYLYRVSDEWVAFFAGSEIENAFKAVKDKQMAEMISLTREQIRQESAVAGLFDDISVEIDYDVTVESQDYFYLLPTAAAFNEEWTALESNISMSMTTEFKGMPEIPGVPTKYTINTYTTLVETGYVAGTETIETPAGTFEDCLRIEYRTDASIKIVLPEEMALFEGTTEPEHQEQKDVSLTTLWLAPNVGIVKFVHNHQLSEEEKELGLEPPRERTLELTGYEIKSSPLGQ